MRSNPIGENKVHFEFKSIQTHWVTPEIKLLDKSN